MKAMEDSVKQMVNVPVNVQDLNLISELETAIDFILTNPVLLSIILDKRKLLFLVPIRQLYDRCSFELFKEDIKMTIANTLNSPTIEYIIFSEEIKSAHPIDVWNATWSMIKDDEIINHLFNQAIQRFIVNNSQDVEKAIDESNCKFGNPLNYPSVTFRIGELAIYVARMIVGTINNLAQLLTGNTSGITDTRTILVNYLTNIS